MNIKKLVLAIVAAYVAMSILGFGSDVLLADYTPMMKALGRQGADLEGHMMWMMLGYLIVTAVFCFLYAHHHEGKGWVEGARFGLYIGVMMSGITMVMYAVLPMDGMESLLSAIVGIVIYVVGGIVTSLVYKTDAGADG